MNREEAAEELSISVRSLQRAVKAKKIAVAYKRGASGKMEAVFDKDEIIHYKAQMSELIRPDDATGDAAVESLALAVTRRDNQLARFVAGIARESASAAIEAMHAKPTVAIEAKTLLKLDEAALITGLARAHLRDAIEAKKLKAKIIGRAWRVKRADLDSYIRNL
jgi:excisionase family DNA binding protein